MNLSSPPQKKKKKKKKILPISYYFQSRFTSNNLQTLNFGTQK